MSFSCVYFCCVVQKLFGVVLFLKDRLSRTVVDPWGLYKACSGFLQFPSCIKRFALRVLHPLCPVFPHYLGDFASLITAPIGLKNNSAISPITLHSVGLELYQYKHAMSRFSLL
jgi:hypothetical protein